MAGRDQIPGEYSPYEDVRNHERYHSRLVRGQIRSVNTDDGIATVDTIDVVGTRQITVPPLWFSATGRTSAWGRYMPMGDEVVDVAYRNDDTAVINNYDATATQDRSAGWSFLRTLKEAGNVPGIAVFRNLKRGEWDFKSSGDAYIHGSNQGTLTLAGGQAFIKLDKLNYRMESRSSEFHQNSETAETRFGTVFRKALPTDLAESPVSSGVFKEFLVDVNFPLPTGTPSVQSRAKLHFGDILDNTTLTPVLGKFGAPLRARISLGNTADLLEVFKLEIDALGNVDWVQSQPATQTSIITDQTTVTLNGLLGRLFIELAGTTTVKVAIADHLQTLYTNLFNWLATHTHPTGVGPSGPPVQAASIPPYDVKINSGKLNIPDGVT